MALSGTPLSTHRARPNRPSSAAQQAAGGLLALAAIDEQAVMFDEDRIAHGLAAFAEQDRFPDAEPCTRSLIEHGQRDGPAVLTGGQQPRIVAKRASARQPVQAQD